MKSKQNKTALKWQIYLQLVYFVVRKAEEKNPENSMREGPLNPYPAGTEND